MTPGPIDTPGTPIGVEVADLTLRYGDTTALDRVSFTLEPGKIYGLIGRNGSGKTSLLSLLAAFRRATAGTVRVGGADPFENWRVTRQVCLIRESGDLFDTETCGDVLRLAGRLRPWWDEEYARALLKRFNLPVKKTPQKLSRGQRSALACTLGLASRAPLTMFDESYLGMDAPSRYAFYEELLADYAAHPRTIILSTHLIEEFGSLFEEVVMIDQGRLLLHEETEALRARGVVVTGPADAVDRLVAPARPGRATAADNGADDGAATGLTVLAQRSLGGTRSVTVSGQLTGEQRRQAQAGGLHLEPVSLQDLFVYLTAGQPAVDETPGPAGDTGPTTPEGQA